MKGGLWEQVSAITSEWERDNESGVVWAGEFENRLGVRIEQDCRDATTIWFNPGTITLHFEAYLFGRVSNHELARRFLRFNTGSWPVIVAYDSREDIFLSGRLPVQVIDEETLGIIVAAVHTGVERLFPHCIDAIKAERETSR